MSDKTELLLRERIAQILKDGITFSPQVGTYVIHGAIDEIIKLGKDWFQDLQHTKDCVHEKSNESSERFKKIIELNQELASLREQLEKLELALVTRDGELTNKVLVKQLKQKEDENRELKSKAQELYNYIEAVTMKTIHQYSPHTQDLLKYLKNLSA